MFRAISFTSDTRWIARVMLCVGMLVIVLDTTVVNVALPSIQNDLGFSQANLVWMVNAHMIAFGGLLLAGRLGDLIGSKRVFIAGLAAFTFAALCAASLGVAKCSSQLAFCKGSAARSRRQ